MHGSVILIKELYKERIHLSGIVIIKCWFVKPTQECSSSTDNRLIAVLRWKEFFEQLLFKEWNHVIPRNPFVLVHMHSKVSYYIIYVNLKS